MATSTRIAQNAKYSLYSRTIGDEVVNEVISWARTLAEYHLALGLPRRWAHVVGVTNRAIALNPIFRQEAGLLVAVAYLHDIGYASDLVDTGFHPVDGAVSPQDRR
jgi:hypothetical protein